MGKSLNRVEIIGNLTKDPELKNTNSGTAVCTFTVATNRDWVKSTGEKQEETEFHRVVAWEKLAELCAQLLTKGARVYIQGRIQTKEITLSDGTKRDSTEIVASDMIVLSSKAVTTEPGHEEIIIETTEVVTKIG